jgi:hypothetical protein
MEVADSSKALLPTYLPEFAVLALLVKVEMANTGGGVKFASCCMNTTIYTISTVNATTVY